MSRTKISCSRLQTLRTSTWTLLLPGLSINTSRSDDRVVKEFRMVRLNGERWEPCGPTGAVGRLKPAYKMATVGTSRTIGTICRVMD
jgi:hypothetical protein